MLVSLVSLNRSGAIKTSMKSSDSRWTSWTLGKISATKSPMTTWMTGMETLTNLSITEEATTHVKTIRTNSNVSNGLPFWS